MARYTRMQTLLAMYHTGLVPIFYHPNPAVAINVVKACALGGIKVVEFTNRADRACEVFLELERQCVQEFPEVVLGAGSIVDPGTASLFLNYGANFVVGPNCNPDIAKVCNRRKIPYMPGCATSSEIAYAEELGCEIVKIFPGQEVGGPQFVKAIKGPCPWSSIMPTGNIGTDEKSLAEWFEAGIVCAGIGSNLITKELVEKEDYEAITERVSRTLHTIAGILQRLKKKKKSN